MLVPDGYTESYDDVHEILVTDGDRIIILWWCTAMEHAVLMSDSHTVYDDVHESLVSDGDTESYDDVHEILVTDGDTESYDDVQPWNENF